MRGVTLTLIGALSLTACGSEPIDGASTAQVEAAEPTDDPEPTVTDTDTPDADDTATSSTSTSPSTGGEQPPTTAPDESPANDAALDLTATQRTLAEEAIADLSERIDVPAGDIGVRTVEEVTWRDGSIGCPDPEFQYTQALVPGVLVVLDHDGFAYHYHQGGDRDLFYCPTPAAPLRD